MRIKILAFVVVAALAGCKSGAQIPPTTHTVTLTVTSTVPTGATWVASKATLTSGATTCPATAGTSYVQINAAPQNSATFVDSTSAGTTVCEIMQYELAGAVSPSSNAVGPLVVPANPTAPVVNGTVASAADSAPLPPPAPTMTRTKQDTPALVAQIR